MTTTDPTAPATDAHGFTSEATPADRRALLSVRPEHEVSPRGMRNARLLSQVIEEDAPCA